MVTHVLFLDVDACFAGVFTLKIELYIYDPCIFLHMCSISVNTLTYTHMPRTEAGSHCTMMLIEASPG